MDQFELFQRLGVALAAGLLVGLERGWHSREDEDTDRAAGLRTFGLSGLLGGVCAALSTVTHPLVLAAGLVAFTAAVGAFSLMEAAAERNLSATGLVAAILTFVLGAYAVLGQPAVTIAAAVTMTILLALRDQLHGLIRAITWLELRAVLTLLAMTFLLLPILPNRTIDPWNAINPSEIWLFAILIAAVSFVGYVLVRTTGDRVGIGLASVTGGLTSSTATTLSLAKLAREGSLRPALLAGGALLAGSIMMFRIVVIAALARPDLAGRLAVPVAIAGLLCALAGAAMVIGRGGDENKPAQRDFGLKNPFDLAMVLKLAALIAVIGVVANILSATIGDRGVYAVAAMSGLADVDAVTLSIARMSSVAIDTAAVAVLIAVTANTVSKTAMALYVGGRAFGALVGTVNLAAIAVMFIAYFVMPAGVTLWPDVQAIR